jgi:hypothetical protein
MLGFPRQRDGDACERGRRVDALLLDFVNLEFRNPANKAEMVVLAPPSIALHPPPADVTMLFGVWVGAVRPTFDECCFEPCFDQTVVCGEVIYSERLRLKFRPGQNNVHLLGDFALRPREKVGIQAKLKNGASFRLSREFCVEDLVAPVSKQTGDFDAS